MNPHGLSTAILHRLSRPEALAKVAEAGFGFVELDPSAGHLDDWAADPAGLRRELEQQGLAAWSVHSPNSGWDLAAAEEPARLAAIEAVRGCLRPAAEVGANLVVCHCNKPGGRPFAPDDYSASLKRTARSLERLTEAAADVGLRLAVENMIPRPGKRPGTRIAELLDLIDGLGDHVGICLDTGHHHSTGADTAAEALLAGEKLFSLHLQDNPGLPDQDEHLVPGVGTIDWEGLLDALERLEFSSPRIIEVITDGTAGGLEQTMQKLAALLRGWDSRPGPRGADSG